MAQFYASFIKAGLAFQLSSGLCLAGYASFTMAFVLGVVALFKPGAQDLELGSFWARIMGSPELKFEKLNRQWLRFGFLMLTVGLIIGSIGATFTGSDFLAQGPKGNWDLVTWLIYGSVLHLHYLPEFKGRKALWASVLAWGFLVFSYFGVANLPANSQAMRRPAAGEPGT